MTRRRERARQVSELVTILWRDIPAQVTARSGTEKVAEKLPERFQVAIDRAAAVAEKVTYDQYIGEWRRESSPLDGDMKLAVDAEVSRIVESFTRERMASLVANGGYEQLTSADVAAADEEPDVA